jgi:pimeloyl-ACP methyl ester carboxylesterase
MILSYLRRLGYGKFAVWGRSMGAVTALLYMAAHPEITDIACTILDSPFSSLVDLSRELVAATENRLPRKLLSGMVSLGLKMVRKSVQRKVCE